jgi:hypothetical protein
MKKVFCFCISLFLLLGTVYSQDIKLAAIACQDMLLDQNNTLRYSVLNTIDNNSSNVYAVENVKIIKGKVFIGFYMAESAKIDSIVLEHGYFDSKYFDANNRLKTIQVIKKLDGKSISEENFTLQDKMESQKLTLKSDAECNVIEIILLDIYKGNKWDDTVVSEISFYNKGKKLSVGFVQDSNSLYKEYYHSFRYIPSTHFVNAFPIIEEHFQYGKAGSETYYYYEDVYLKRYVAGIHEDMDETYSLVYHYKDRKSKGPYELLEYDQTGKLKRQTTFDYDSNGKLIKEQREYYIKTYNYDKDGNLIKIVQEATNKTWAKDQVIEYTYKNNLIASEKITKNNNLDQIYQYVYEQNKLVQKICICDKSNKIPTNYYYSYDKDGRLIDEYTMYSFKW